MIKQKSQNFAAAMLASFLLIWPLSAYAESLQNKSAENVYERTFNDLNRHEQFIKAPAKAETLGDKIVGGVKWFATALRSHQGSDRSILKIYQESEFSEKDNYFHVNWCYKDDYDQHHFVEGDWWWQYRD